MKCYSLSRTLPGRRKAAAELEPLFSIIALGCGGIRFTSPTLQHTPAPYVWSRAGRSLKEGPFPELTFILLHLRRLSQAARREDLPVLYTDMLLVDWTTSNVYDKTGWTYRSGRPGVPERQADNLKKQIPEKHEKMTTGKQPHGTR